MSLAIRFAQVVRVYPKYRTCEIAYLDDGWRAQNVPILSDYASSNSGGWSMHNMPRPPSEEDAGGYHPDPAERTVLAVVAMVDDRPLVIGFLPHAMTQMAFVQEEQNRDIWRHPSGTITTINRNGSMEIQHTGGAFIRVAAQVDSDIEPDRHEDLTDKAWNENWVLPENDPATITITTGNRDGEALKIRLRPNGDVDQMSSGYLHIEHAKDLHVDIGEHAQIHITDHYTTSAGDDIKQRTPANITISAGDNLRLQAKGDVILTAGGNLTAQTEGNATVSAAGAATVEANQSIEVFSPLAINLVSTVVNVTAPLFNVLGLIVEEGQVAAAEAAVLARTAAYEAKLLATLTPAVLELEGEIEAAEADVMEAAENIEAAVLEAVETVEPAVGTGEPDNLGGISPGATSMGDEGEVVG